MVAQDVERPFVRNYGDLKVHFEGLPSLVKRIAGAMAMASAAATRK